MRGRAFTVAVEGAILAGEMRLPDNETQGAATPLVFIHGMAGSRADWDRLIAALPQDRPTLAYDLRGFGQSVESADAPFSHTADLLALLDAQGIRQATLVGLSMGGSIALNFALSHPERVERLILISSALIGWEWSDEWKTLWRRVTAPARAGDMGLAREQWLAHPMFAHVLKSDAAEEFREAVAAYPGQQWIRDNQRPEMPDVDRLHQLAVPTLLLAGEYDVADIRLIADLIAGAAPGVTRQDFAGAGHMLHVERTGEVAHAITSFC